MKFLIIGASGFVGRNVLAYVRSVGFKAVGTQSQLREEGLVKFNLLEDRIVDCVGKSFFEDDLVCVVNCAVVSNMDQCLLEREKSYRINVEQTIQMIDDVRAYGAKNVFLSTCFVFDGTIGYYNEDYPVSPINEYARHKVAVEEYLQQHVPDALITRLEKIVGDNPKDRQLLAFWYNHLCNGNPLVCWEGSLLSPTYVKDVANGIVLACEKGLTGIYHLSNSEFFYRDELARQFCYAVGKPANVINKPLSEFNFPDKRALKSYLDGTKFVKATGLRFTSMREVFRNFVQHIDS